MPPADWCDKHLTGRVVLTKKARKELEDPAYQDPPAAARALLWLAGPYRTSRIEGGGTDLRENVAEALYNTPAGSFAFEEEWRGRRMEFSWHLKNGGKNFAPNRSLRIYYAWDPETEQVVVASMPGHL